MKQQSLGCAARPYTHALFPFRFCFQPLSSTSSRKSPSLYGTDYGYGSFSSPEDVEIIAPYPPSA
jgi:hypothetical protein